MLRLSVLLLWVTLVYSFSIHQNGPRIINGDEAQPGQFPWQAAVNISRSSGSSFCGGTIISRTWILTSATCLEEALSVRVNVGSVLVSGGTQIEVPVASVIIHEDYDSETLENDIGLIPLGVELIFNEETSAITMAEDPIEAGREVVVSGWGYTSDESTQASETLNYIFLSTISNSDCAAIYGTLSDTVLCAVSTGVVKATCKGDSGSALVSNINTLPIFVGIASFGSGSGCEAGHPSGFTRVASYRDWIQTQTGL